MVRGKEDIGQHLVVDSSEVENVTEFVYLGSWLTSDGDCRKQIKRRIEEWRQEDIHTLNRQKGTYMIVISEDKTVNYAVKTNGQEPME